MRNIRPCDGGKRFAQQLASRIRPEGNCSPSWEARCAGSTIASTSVCNGFGGSPGLGAETILRAASRCLHAELARRCLAVNPGDTDRATVAARGDRLARAERHELSVSHVEADPAIGCSRRARLDHHHDRVFAPEHLLVGHLIKGLGRGGAESLLPQALRVGGRGLRYRVAYFLPWKSALAEEIESTGTSVECFGCRSNASMILSTRRTTRWMRRTGLDLAHAHLPLAGVVARIAARRAGIPLVYTEHNLQERYHPWTRRANAWTWRMQEHVVAVSQEVADSIRRNLGDRVPVTVIRNGIDVPRFAVAANEVARVRRELGIPPGAPVVGTVAVFRAQKRLDLWLEVASRLLSEHPETRFLLVGDGPLRGELEARARELGLGGSAIFCGLQEDVAPYLSAMDVFLSTSEFEGLPLALLEAMAAGRPVVATAVGGVGEVIRDAENGLLLPFGDLDRATEAVSRLLGDREAARRLGEEGRRTVERDFGIERMVRETEALYRRVLVARSDDRP